MPLQRALAAGVPEGLLKVSSCLPVLMQGSVGRATPLPGLEVQGIQSQGLGAVLSCLSVLLQLQMGHGSVGICHCARLQLYAPVQAALRMQIRNMEGGAGETRGRRQYCQQQYL